MVDKTNSKSKVNLRVGMTVTESVTLRHFSQPCGQVTGGAGEESDKAAAPCPFKISLHWGYMLEAQQRNPQLSGSRWNVLPLSPAFTLLKDALWLASPVQGGGKAHHFSRDNSSNGLSDEWTESRCLCLFIHTDSLSVNFSANGGMNWASGSQSVGWRTLNPLGQ